MWFDAVWFGELLSIVITVQIGSDDSWEGPLAWHIVASAVLIVVPPSSNLLWGGGLSIINLCVVRVMTGCFFPSTFRPSQLHLLLFQDTDLSPVWVSCLHLDVQLFYLHF